MRVERRRALAAPAEDVWATIVDWRSHAEWQPSLVEVDAPDTIVAGTTLIEVRSSHGQRLTFDVRIADVEAPRRLVALGKSRGVVSISVALEYELAAAGAGTEVQIAVEADLPFVLLPLRHAVVSEVEKELDAMLDRLAALEGSRF